MAAPSDWAVSRRTLLKSLFFGATAASSPQWLVSRARAQAASELPIPNGPLAYIPDVVPVTLTDTKRLKLEGFKALAKAFAQD